jgi:Fungal specific transcription factor domain
MLGIDQSSINTCLPLFFVYQYPQFMFIYREAFLSDYFDNAYGGKYWSFPLVYALCALGAVHSDNESIRAKARVFAQCAREITISTELGKSSLSTMQTLLCLAFHELGQGSASQGWLFAGMFCVIPMFCFFVFLTYRCSG